MGTNRNLRLESYQHSICSSLYTCLILVSSGRLAYTSFPLHGTSMTTKSSRGYISSIQYTSPAEARLISVLMPNTSGKMFIGLGVCSWSNWLWLWGRSPVASRRPAVVTMWFREWDMSQEKTQSWAANPWEATIILNLPFGGPELPALVLYLSFPPWAIP